MNSLIVISAGFYTGVQDSGRYGYRSFGVPTSGPMDRLSFDRVQQLLGNDATNAVLESTLNGPTLLFNGNTKLAVSGAQVPVFINDRPVRMDEVLDCQLGDVLSFGTCKKGVRFYIAIAGGFQTPKFLDSRSYFSSITGKSSLEKGDKLYFKPPPKKTLKPPQALLSNLCCFETSKLDVYPGPEWSLLSTDLQSQLLGSNYKVGSNDRMGYRLLGTLPRNNFQLPSSAIQPGVVQLTPGGDLLVAMADAQVTGGYPRVLQLTPQSQSCLAQQNTGQELGFELKSTIFQNKQFQKEL